MNNRAVLLVNLGSPESTDTSSVRRYLNQFLMDPFVIQLPWLIRRLIVSLFVLPRRPANSARAYQKIWLKEGSPLVVLSMRLLESLKEKIDIPVAMAMRYGKPDIESTLLGLLKNPEIDELVFIPLYPHYAESTFRTSVEEVKRVITRHKLKLKLLVIKPFYNNPAYINALAESARPWLEDKNFDHVLFSYHGLPEIHLKKADPTGKHCLQSPECCQTPSPAHDVCYRHQLITTTEEFTRLTGLDRKQYSIAYQSRLGRAKWLEPSTENTLRSLAESGVKNLLVLCPAFVTDCLETLEEIGIQGDEIFRQSGGENLVLVPCLNNHAEWTNCLVEWIKKEPESGIFYPDNPG